MNRKIIIRGITKSGASFRPSDWAERLCDCLASFGHGERVRYSALAQPIIRDGLRCIELDPQLAQVDSAAFQFITQFARDNDLMVSGTEVGGAMLFAA